jgi:hypothetical protein
LAPAVIAGVLWVENRGTVLTTIIKLLKRVQPTGRHRSKIRYYVWRRGAVQMSLNRDLMPVNAKLETEPEITIKYGVAIARVQTTFVVTQRISNHQYLMLSPLP